MGYVEDSSGRATQDDGSVKALRSRHHHFFQSCSSREALNCWELRSRLGAAHLIVVLRLNPFLYFANLYICCNSFWRCHVTTSRQTDHSDNANARRRGRQIAARIWLRQDEGLRSIPP